MNPLTTFMDTLGVVVTDSIVLGSTAAAVYTIVFAWRHRKEKAPIAVVMPAWEEESELEMERRLR